MRGGAGRRWNPVASDFRACRPGLPGLPRLPRLPYRTAWSVWKPQRGCVAATERLCGSHTGCLCVEATQRLCGSHTRAVAVPQQHIVAVEKPHQLCWLYKICCLYKVYMPVKQARIRPENIDSGTNGVEKPPFGLKLCVPGPIGPYFLCGTDKHGFFRHGFLCGTDRHGTSLA